MPSSSANLGPGFDVFSMALERPSLKIGAKLLDGPEGVEITAIGGEYASEVISSPDRNSAGKAATLLIKRCQLKRRVRIMIDAGIPVRKGLGASGAEAVGAIVSLSALFGLRLKPLEIIEIASSVEPGGHADNVAASLNGGINIVDKTGDKLDILRIDPPSNLALVVIVPSIEKLSTNSARSVVPKSVSVENYIRGISQISMITVGLIRGDLKTVFRHVSFDYVVEAARANAGIYGEAYNWKVLLEEKQMLLDEYNVALTISGAGPSRLLWYDLNENQEEPSNRPVDRAVKLVVENMKRHGYGVKEIIYTRPARHGAILIDN